MRDGGTDLADEIGRFCSEKPNSVKSTGNMLYVKYYTNATDPQNGFKARVSLGGYSSPSEFVDSAAGKCNRFTFQRVSQIVVEESLPVQAE